MGAVGRTKKQSINYMIPTGRTNKKTPRPHRQSPHAEPLYSAKPHVECVRPAQYPNYQIDAWGSDLLDLGKRIAEAKKD
jgi:hypothetical protein